MPTHSKISASIVLFKSDAKLVTAAVASFLNSCPQGTLYLVDNSPTDSLRKYFGSDERVHYHFNDKNLGFGSAHNIAMRLSQESGSTYHLVLNPDVYFEKDVIPKITSLMDGHPEVGLVMPKVLYPDGTIQHLCKLLPSPDHLFFRRFFAFHKNFVDRRNELYELKFSGYDKIMDIPCLSGCFMMLRNDCLKKIGLFDEDIFLYTEDIDLTRRIHKHYRTIYFPGATIYHVHARASYRQVLPFFLHLKSAITYFNKWGWFNDPEREYINRVTILKLTQ